MVRFRMWMFAFLVAGCAGGHAASRGGGAAGGAGTAGGEAQAAPGPGDEAMGSGSGQPESDPEGVRTGKTFKLDYAAAQARYAKGSSCVGGSAPETVLGAPDQRNEMQMGKVKLVTYGFRYKEGTLLIRCRGDHVEVARALK